MSNPIQNGIGPEIKTAIGVVPANREAGEVKGSAIDRLGFNSCVLVGVTGALESNPSVHSTTVKLQHSDTTTDGDFSDVTGGGVTAIAAVNTAKRKSINLKPLKRYVRAVLTVGEFTGGTTPKINCAALVLLGGAVETPAQADD